MRQTMILITFAVFANSAAIAQQQRVVPPVHVTTHQDVEEAQKQKASDAQRPPMDEEYKFLFEMYMARFDEAFAVRESLSEAKPAPSIGDATSLVDSLYEDMQHPTLNDRWQDIVVGEITFSATRTDLSEGAADVLREGLLAYASAGGGLSSPCSEIYLARALAVLGGPRYPECDEQSLKLIKHANAHAQDLGTPFYTGVVRKYEERIQEITRRKNTSPVELQKAWGKADHALRSLAMGDYSSAEAIARVARLASTDFGDADTNEDMIARLLIAYRLRLENKKGFNKRILQQIDRNLLLLVTKPCKLTSDRHWMLWANAVGKIKRRFVSRELHRYLIEAERNKQNAVVAKSAKKAIKHLRLQ